MVLASKPDASVMRLAARPVGAHSKSLAPFAARMRRTRVTCGETLISREIQHARRLARISRTELIGCSTRALGAEAPIDAMPLTIAAFTIAMGFLKMDGLEPPRVFMVFCLPLFYHSAMA